MENPKVKILEQLYEYSGDELNLKEEQWDDARCLMQIFDFHLSHFVIWLIKNKYIVSEKTELKDINKLLVIYKNEYDE